MFTRMSVAWGLSRSRRRGGHKTGDREDGNHGGQKTTPRDNVGPALGGFPRYGTHVHFPQNPGVRCAPMPRKIRDLVRDLVKAGFEERRGKGNHRNYSHPLFAEVVTISGKDGDDSLSASRENGSEGHRRGEPVAKGDRYLKVVAWSDEDKCFIGT